MTHLFCFGLGYSANRLAARLALKGWTISGTSRNAAGVAALIANGYGGHIFNGDKPSPAVTNELQRATHVLMSIPPNDDGDPA